MMDFLSFLPSKEFWSSVNTQEGHIGLALLSITLICLEYYFIMGRVGGVRGKLFNKEFMEKFDKEHV